MSELNRPLEGLRVLIVEDEALVAMLIEEYLAEMGCVVTASVRRVSAALEKVKCAEFDAAILDMNVGGEPVLPVADALAAKGVPFIFASGYGEKRQEVPVKHPIVQKPFTLEELGKALRSAVSDREKYSRLPV